MLRSNRAVATITQVTPTERVESAVAILAMHEITKIGKRANSFFSMVSGAIPLPFRNLLLNVSKLKGS